MGADAEVLDRKSAVPALIGDPADFLIIGGLAGTATALACALLGLECVIYMGKTDMERQAPSLSAHDIAC